MLSFTQRWIKRLRLNQVYGQLILFMFLPAFLLTSVGSWLIYTEIKKNYIITQRYMVQSILKQQKLSLQEQLKIQYIDGFNQPSMGIQYVLQQIMLEKEVQSVSLFYQNQSILSLGKHIPLDILKQYQLSNHHHDFIGPILYQEHHLFAMPVQFEQNTAWLIIELNNQGLSILIYRMILILGLIILMSFLFLFISLGLYARYWLSPIYKMRLQLQQLHVGNLNEYRIITSSGELSQLQKDIYDLIEELNQQFQQIRYYTEETENDTRQILDRIELESAGYQRELRAIKNTNQSKSLFLANISHELRTPLNSIEGFIQLLLRQKNIPNEQKIYLETIKKSSAHLLALINDVLDYSKIEAGKLQLELYAFNLEDAIFDVMDMLSPLASQKNLDLVFYYPTGLPHSILGDELRFKQILMNLISNAIKFTPEGEIIVRVRLEKILDEQYLIYFSVQDSGIGLSGTDKNKLFESFSQADGSIIRQYGGTGLGLAISKQLVQMMDGEIGFIENQTQTLTEKGSTFWFTALFKHNPQELSQQIEYPIQPLNILSYLNRPAMSSVLRYYLEHDNIQHYEAHSAFDLLHQLHEMRNNPPDWVLIDEQHDLKTSLKEIRQRYQGRLTVCGYQMSLNLTLLKQYQACALYQPIYRTALWQLFYGDYQHQDKYIEWNGKDLNILAVDDHIPNLMVLDALLQELKIKIVQANSGQEAIQIIQQRIEQKLPLFDLIFMDIQMPIMSGLDATRAIRSLESTLDRQETMAIVALSAHILHDDEDKILASGMNDMISKPIRMEQLLYILQKWTNINQQNTQPLPKLPANSSEQSEEPINKEILDWDLSVELVANKPQLAKELLIMLINSFDDVCIETQDLIDLEDFPALEQVLHRLHGATRYVGTPKLQQITGDFEQFISILRKEQRQADDEFAHNVQQRFAQLQECMAQVREAVKQYVENK